MRRGLRQTRRRSRQQQLRTRDKRQIADDTAGLLKLANNLKTEVDKSTPDTLSVSVIRQAGEIEKLAHKMRTK